MTEDPGDFGHLVGTVLSDRYQIKALLGEGGMGAVFEGEHLLMHKRVAIKMLRPEVSQAGEVVARFEREAMAAAHIDHPNVVTATDFGRTPEGAFFLVLEYVEGQNLRVVLLEGPMPLARTLRIAEQIASVLVKAHSLGIVHRDLKPENVMLLRKEDDPDFIKVLDFGIAKVPVDELSGQQVSTAQGLTRLGVMYGTPEYMAPEQAMGTGVDHRADLYSLGVMLFEMVTGTRPFDAENVISLVTMHIIEPPPSLESRLPPGAVVPPGLAELIAQLLEKDREKRPQSARELVDRLRALQSGAPAPERSPTPPPSGALAEAPTSGAAESFASARTAMEASPQPPASLNVASAVTTAGASGPGYTRTALLDSPEPRWRRELREAIPELEKIRDNLPAPLSRLPLLAFPAAAAGLLSITLLVAFWPRGQATAPDVPAASASAAPAELTDEKIDEARRLGASALEDLAERHPEDVRIVRALLKLHHEAKRPTEAMKALGRLAKLQPELVSDDLALSALKAAVDGPPEAADAAFSLLESGMGEGGIEILYAMWTSKKEVSAKAQARAGKTLTKSEVKERAPKPLRALIDLRAVPASCETRRAGVELAREAGDARAVPLMQQLTTKRGCGFAGLQDCWGCLRRDNLLNEAIRAAEKRPEP